MNLQRFLSEVLGWHRAADGREPTAEERAEFGRQWREVRRDSRGFVVRSEPRFDAGSHPQHFFDFEMEFAATQVARARPGSILDIGSYRGFLVGLAAGYDLTTLDVRERPPRFEREKVLTGDARSLPLPDGSVECLVTLCAIEHFGLGRYGDPFDLDGDVRACREMGRVLRPGGLLVASLPFTRGPATLAFNSHRIYDRARIDALFPGLRLRDVAYVSQELGPCALDQNEERPGRWGVLCGAWVKDGAGSP
jgi:SAM-dependent methyltransferase